MWLVISSILYWRENGDTPFLIASLLVAAIFLWFAVGRCALAGARPEPEGLKVRNPLKTIQLPWSEIVRIRVGTHGIEPVIAIVDLRDGRSVHIWGLQGPAAVISTEGETTPRGNGEPASAHGRRSPSKAATRPTDS
jgi:hypothetical protein